LVLYTNFVLRNKEVISKNTIINDLQSKLQQLKDASVNENDIPINIGQQKLETLPPLPSDTQATAPINAPGDSSWVIEKKYQKRISTLKSQTQTLVS
jgi:hypothetical protein